MQAPGAVEHSRSISSPDAVNGDLNQALVSLGLVLRTFVVFIDCCLGFSMLSLDCCYISFASTSQVTG